MRTKGKGVRNSNFCGHHIWKIPKASPKHRRRRGKLRLIALFRHFPDASSRLKLQKSEEATGNFGPFWERGTERDRERRDDGILSRLLSASRRSTFTAFEMGDNQRQQSASRSLAIYSFKFCIMVNIANRMNKQSNQSHGYPWLHGMVLLSYNCCLKHRLE